MPQLIVCGSCRAVLYSSLDLEMPNEIIRKYNGVCPKCGKKLNYSLEKIKITPFIEEAMTEVIPEINVNQAPLPLNCGKKAKD